MSAVLRRPLAVAVAAAAVGLGPAAHAAPDSLATIRELVQQGQYQRAYEHGLAAEARYEGDPAFDFHFGLAALETGNHGDAIFALERVLLARPDQLRVRLELARAHFLAENYGAARQEFERVLAEDPPPAVRGNIRRFLERIEVAERGQRRTFEVAALVRAGTDSNINSATSEATINTPIGSFDLVEDGREQEDEFVRARLGARFSQPLTRETSFDAAASYERKDNLDSDEFDLGVALIESGWSRELENGTARVGIRLQNVTLDDQRFQDAFGLTGSWNRGLGRNLVLSLTGAATGIRYDDQDGRDVNQFLGSAALVRPAGRLVHTLSLYAATEDARFDRGEFNGRDFAGVLYGVQASAGSATPYLRLAAQQARHHEEHPVFGEERDDVTLRAAGGLRWAVTDGFGLTAEASWTEVDSNLEVFEFDRFQLEAGFQLTF